MSLPTDRAHLCGICRRVTKMLKYNPLLVGVRMQEFWYCPQCDFNRPVTIGRRITAHG